MNEIAKFDRTDWWDPQGAFKTLHHINPCRIDFICDHIGDSQQNKRVLDLGCGAGIATIALAERGYNCTGVDLASNAIKSASSEAQARNITNVDFRVADSETLLNEQSDKQNDKHNQQPYDTIICLEMLEHVADPQLIINDCAKLVKPGGKLVLSTISKTPEAFFKLIIGAEYVANLLPKGTHDYRHFIKPSTLARICEQAEFEVDLIRGLDYNPLTEKTRISSRPTCNYLLVAHKSNP